ncbi:MAG: glycosyltransferase family 4 protein [Chthoniobacterales bacterium]
MRPTRVLIAAPCQGGYGGIEAFILAVAEAVRREPEMEARICLLRTKGTKMQPDLKAMLRGEDPLICERVDRDLVAAIRWADVVHLQNASPAVVFLSKLFCKRLVLTIHNHQPKGFDLQRWSAPFANERWYNSQFVWNNWEPAKKRAGSRKVPTTSVFPEGWTPPAERRGFVFIGRWLANKGIDTLLDAYAQAQLDREQWPLVMMGDGPLRSLIEYAVKKRGVPGIEVLGFVDPETKTERIRNARWMVVPPNTKEGLGLAALEARNVGVPCIITRDGGLPEAGGGQALMCEPNNPAALSALLEQAATMSEAEYAARAHRTCEELAAELEPIGFYAREFRRLAAAR